MITFIESKERTKESERCLDSQLWHACAGSMVQMPPVNAKVFYFPQGHFEHVSGNLNFRNCPRFPAYVTCRVSEVKFMADPETDEVFAKIRLIPIAKTEIDLDKVGASEVNGFEQRDKPTSFAKTLTQSDANNGGGFSVPRYCAETIFPRLDYTADPPVQTILVKDVHGEVWKFRHIYRGTPRRHLLTTGWSTFVNRKKLVAGDSIVFLRAENGDLCVGIRRAKNGIGGGPEVPLQWNPSGGSHVVPFGGFSMFFREDESKLSRNSSGNSNGSLISKGRVRTEDVVEAATLAADEKPFDVVYYPRASNPEFCVVASLVKAALQIRWCSGMRFKMAFETEDSSRISWFMGTISSVMVADPLRWPDSPWRLLQVRWDEPDLLQNVKRVNPWSVELVSNLPNIHLSPFSPPHKKLRLPQLPDFPIDGQLPLSAFTGSHHLLGSSYPFGCLSDNAPAGMQGARHGQYGITLSDLHFSKLRSGPFPPDPRPLYRASVPSGASNSVASEPSCDEKVSCLLTMGSSAQGSMKSDSRKEAPFVLFGQQISVISCSSGHSSSDCNGDKARNTSDDTHERSSWERFQSELSMETGHCKVFMESEDVGRTLNLSLLGSYDELHKKLACMFRVEMSEISKHIVYRDTAGAVRQLGEEPFSKFSKTARRLRVVADSSCDNVGV